MRQIAGVAVFAVLGLSQAHAACLPDVVDLRGEGASARFTVEIADTPESQRRGLMFRETLPRASGMLFVYDVPTRAVFWMKNTLIPLDMVFADPSGTVTAVHSNAVPHDETPIDGGEGVLAVLEINGGLAEKMRIKPGTVLRHPAFSQTSPVWPCD